MIRLFVKKLSGQGNRISWIRPDPVIDTVHGSEQLVRGQPRMVIVVACSKSQILDFSLDVCNLWDTGVFQGLGERDR